MIYFYKVIVLCLRDSLICKLNFFKGKGKQLGKQPWPKAMLRCGWQNGSKPWSVVANSVVNFKKAVENWGWKSEGQGIYLLNSVFNPVSTLLQPIQLTPEYWRYFALQDLFLGLFKDWFILLYSSNNRRMGKMELSYTHSLLCYCT